MPYFDAVTVDILGAIAAVRRWMWVEDAVASDDFNGYLFGGNVS